MGPGPLVGSWRRGEVLTPRDDPSLARSAEIKGELWGLSEERAAIGLWQAGQSETYTDSQCHSPVHPSLRQVSAIADRGWVLECGVWRADPGRELLLAAQTQPEGTGVRNSVTRNAPGGSPDHRRSEVPLQSDAWRAGSPLKLSPYVPAPASTGTRRGSCQSMCMHPNRCQCLPLPPEWVCTLQSATTPTPPSETGPCSWGHCIWSPLPGQGADGCGWPIHRGGAETKPELQEMCD